MDSQTEFIRKTRAAVDRLFAHDNMLGRSMVRFHFRPDGMVIFVGVVAFTDAEMEADRTEVIPWQKLETIDASEFIEIVDRVCMPSHEVLKAKGSA